MVLALFPSISLLVPSGARICWAPFSAELPCQYTSGALRKWQLVLSLDTASLKDPLATFHTWVDSSHRASWHLKGLVDISILTRDFPCAPFILLFVGTRVGTISGGHRCAGWLSSFCKDPYCRKERAEALLGGKNPM